MSELPGDAREILVRGTLCHLAAPSPAGPHVTPVVFVLDGDRLWGTTGRGTTKARRWRRDARAAGLVRAGDRWVTFRGPVTTYDLLDPSRWSDSLRRIPQLTRASARFTLKNARFFAGYARDAPRVPLAWTPPARVLFSVDLEAGAVLREGRAAERWGRWGRRTETSSDYRAARSGLPNGGLPREVRELLAERGQGTIGLEGRVGPVVLPAAWVRSGGTFLAVLPRPLLALSAARGEGRASLVVDHASTWRAAEMRGALVRGMADAFVPGGLRAGARSLAGAIRDAAETIPDPAVVRLRARTVVWWEGWSSGTVGRS